MVGINKLLSSCVRGSSADLILLLLFILGLKFFRVFTILQRNTVDRWDIRQSASRRITLLLNQGFFRNILVNEFHFFVWRWLINCGINLTKSLIFKLKLMRRTMLDRLVCRWLHFFSIDIIWQGRTAQLAHRRASDTCGTMIMWVKSWSSWLF